MSSSNSSLDEGDKAVSLTVGAKSHKATTEQTIPTADPALWTKTVSHKHANQAEAERLTRRIRLLHFNDTYNIEGSENEPKAGAARFLTAIDSLRSSEIPTIVLFSGDTFSPSTCINK
jgi:2',3'-cyclic-nucleotide 2'-phosphodiesterase (5'-nucleotidase family)